MTTTRPSSTLLVLTVAALALAACGKHHKEAEGNAPATAAPLPAIPAWAAPMMGKNIESAFGSSATCKGHFDNVLARYTTAPAGVVVQGWAWDTTGGKAVDRVLLTDSASVVVGAASGGVKRPDVPAALPDVTSQTTGWNGPVQASGGEVTAYALLNDTTACKISTLDIDAS